jgi:RHS repeat-associated protein
MEATSGVQDGIFAVPGGGGGLRSLGESFQPDLLRGSGNYAVPIDLPRGAGGLRPQLSLRYSTGQGNGPFGMGWQLSLPPAITRATDGGVPRYDDTDTLLLGGDALIDVGGGRFRPQADTQCWDIRREGQGWRIRTRDGRHYLLGASADARVADGERVWAWLCEQEIDPAGNVIQYAYLRDGGQLYLRAVTWSIYTLQLEYEPRPDVIRYGRAGFALTTALRCARIERRCAQLAQPLCTTHHLAYEQARGSGISLLASARLEGSDAEGATEAYPPLRFSYRQYTPEPRFMAVTSEDGLLPLGQSDAALVDMDGDGLPDLLQTGRSGHRYWKNLGGGRFSAARPIPDAPHGLRLGEPGVSFADLSGDGTADLFRADTRLSLAVRNTGAGRWSAAPMVVQQQFPLAISAASSRLLDLDGNGVPDILQTGAHGFTLVYNQGESGWSQPEVVPRVHDLARFPDVDLDDEAIYLADMAGDGMTSLVALYSGRVCYWPYYGYGRWGALVEMQAAPALPQGFSRQRLYLTDLDGDGTADIVYVDGDRVLYWLNQSGVGWSERFELPFVPPPAVASLTMVDLLGTGVHGLCWANPGSSGAPARYLDLSSGAKPYLLAEVDNGFGGRTSIEYTTSSLMRSRAPGGDAWHTFMPFPMHVVSALVDRDLITGQRTETQFAYERGYYDPALRVFRGFETVEMRSLGDAYTPTVVQRTTFNLGAMLGPEERYLRSVQQRAVDHALCGSTRQVEIYHEHDDGARTLVSTAVMNWEAREEFGDGQQYVHFPHLRQTSATDLADDAPARIDSASYTYDQFGNVTSKRRETRFSTQAPDDAHVSEQRISYALNEQAWLVGLPARLSTRDGAGRLLNDKRIRYDGDAFEGLPEGQVTRGLVRYSEELALADWALPPGYAAAIDPTWQLRHLDEGWYRLVEAYQHDQLGNVVAQRDSMGRTLTIGYDADQLFPTSAVDADGSRTEASFDARTAQPDTISMPGGNQTRYVYSALGRLRAQLETSADGSMQLTQLFQARYAVLDEAPQPAHVISVRPHQPGASMAALEAADLSQLPEISVEYAYYDGRGNLLQRSRQAASAAGGWVIGGRRIYTRNNQSGEEFPNLPADSPAFRALVPGGAAVRFQYGPTGQVTRLEHPDGGRFLVRYRLERVEKWDAEMADEDLPLVERYNALGQLVGVDTPDGDGGVATTSYSVDHAGRILAITDARGAVTARYTYAGPGPAIAIGHQEAGSRSYYRDAGGNLRRREDSLGRVLALEYDAANRLTTASDLSDAAHPQVVRSMTYQDGALVRQEELGLTTLFVNDRLGRPERKTLDYGDGRQLTLERVYGLQNEVRAMIYPDGSRIDLRYYDGGQLRAIEGIVEQVEYDMHDNPLEVAFGGVSAAYAYDPAMKRLERMQLRAAAGTLRQLAFGYDRNGCITSALDTLAGATTARRYRYDRLYRLVQASSFQGALDGPLLRDDGYAYTATGEIVANGEAGLGALRYDDALHPARLTSVERGGQAVALSYDDGGRLQEFDNLASIRYDIWDRVQELALRDGTRIAYTYDASGQQVRRTVLHAGGGSEDTLYMEGFYEQRGTASRANIYLGKLLVAVRTTPAQGAPSLACVLTDHLGSILATCDQAGTPIHQQAYTPFGLPTLAPAADTRYTGLPPDGEAGMIQMGARWYHPLLGRFITPDWYIIENPSQGQRLPQSLNVYSYAINNPIMLRDPSGKFFGLDDLIVAAVGFVVGFVTGVIVGIAEGRSFGDTLLLGLEAGLCGAAGAWLSYITLGAATAALGAIGLGVGSGVATGLAVGAAVVGGLNGVISGALEIYDWSSPVGWLSFLSDSTWGLVGTTLGVLVHGINLFYGGSRDYSFELSRRQNRHVYDGGFGFGTYAFTQGNVTSNLNGRRSDLVDHETLHIWQSRIFGPIFQVTYIGWLVVGAIVGFLIGIPLAIAGTQGLGQSINDVAYLDNPWESWAYDVGGSGSGGKLAWT